MAESEGFEPSIGRRLSPNVPINQTVSEATTLIRRHSATGYHTKHHTGGPIWAVSMLPPMVSCKAPTRARAPPDSATSQNALFENQQSNNEDNYMPYSKNDTPNWDRYEDHCNLTVRECPNLNGTRIKVGVLTLFEEVTGECTQFIGEYSADRPEDSITNMIRHGRMTD
jgi:hypothetical protein